MTKLSLNDYLKNIITARVYDVARETPVERMPRMGALLDNDVYVKREDLQPVHSFKIRGAYNCVANLSESERNQGIVAASAGNHAQGVALAAQKLSVDCVIYMPVTTPEIKVDSVRQRGVKVVLHGDNFDQACAEAKALQKKESRVFVHPYDDPRVIAGQGTVAMEILRQVHEPLDAIFVPVGGGGLISGIAAYVKAIQPSVKIIGVEADNSACLKAALAAGERVTLDSVGIFADGVAVATIGEEPFRLAKDYVDEVVTVSTDEICAAIKDIFDDVRAIAEPAGAVALAGLKKYATQNSCKNKKFIHVLSGANMNFDRLRHVSERAEMGEGRETILGVRIPERPGSFQALCQTLGRRNVTEFNYRFANAKDAIVFLGVQLSTENNDRAQLMKTIEAEGFTVIDFSENELAKLHVRYLVGGHAAELTNEQVYRFEFPERPGALMSFLETLGAQWNISLFHYRNHGAAFGRVFIGLQVPQGDQEKLDHFLNTFGYTFARETDNPAYQEFLGL